MTSALFSDVEDRQRDRAGDPPHPADAFCRRALRVIGGETPMARLRAIRELRELLDEMEHENAAQARPRATLEDIGRALGYSQSAAHRRFGRSRS